MIRLAAAGLLAAASTGASALNGQDVVTWALSQGPMGAALAILAIGWKRERDRADAERKRSAELADALIERVVPALEGSTRATEDLVALSRERRR
jgi:hypothetical protein